MRNKAFVNLLLVRMTFVNLQLNNPTVVRVQVRLDDYPQLVAVTL